MKRIFVAALLACFWLPALAFAQDTLLPYDEAATQEACEDFYKQAGAEQTFQQAIRTNPEARDWYLTCAIRTGHVRLYMLPYFITYIANFLIGIAGTISVLFVILGGFWYMTGSITDDKEKGKKTITYALAGLGIALLAWIIVNVIQVQVTG